MLCPRCGKTIDEDSTFCNGCGINIQYGYSEYQVWQDREKRRHMYPGKYFLMVSGIILVVFAGFGILWSLSSFDMANSLSNSTSWVLRSFMALIGSGYNLFLGIAGIAYCERTEKAGQLKIMGIIAIVWVVVNTLLRVSGVWFLSGIIFGMGFELVLPILFIIGARKNEAAGLR